MDYKEQCQWVNHISNRNKDIFQIHETAKKKKSYPISPLIKVEFENGWYANITDNNLQTQNCILTFHGAPGSHIEWAGMQYELNKIIPCRWINFVYPGFDGQDERRGNYQGNLEDAINLIQMVLNRRKVEKVVIFAHSYGTWFGNQFIYYKSERVRGLVQICGSISSKFIGLDFLMSVFKQSGIFTQCGFQSEEQRKKYHEKVMEFRNKNPSLLPLMNLTSVMSFGKMMKSQDESIQRNESKKYLRLLGFGKNDVLHQPKKYSKFMHQFAKDYNKSKLPLNPSFKQEVEQLFQKKYKVKVEAEKLQDYFCYEFDNTGHNLHKRRPEEWSKIMSIYLDVLPIVEKYNDLQNSKL